MQHYQIVHLSFMELIVPFAVLMAVVSYFILSKKPYTDDSSGQKADWSVPSIDKYAQGDSLFHLWDARLKIFSLMVYIFVVSSLGTVPICLAAVVISVIALLIAGIPWQRSLNRLKAMSGFLVMFLLILPFTVKGIEGEKLFVIGGIESLPFHSSGFLKASIIILKASAIALLMEPLFSTSPFPVTLLAISRLGMPVVICQMILLSHRYIHVFLQEMRRMYRGMKVRGFRKRTDLETLRSLGNLLGMLIVRSFDRTQRVYDAMLSRGYCGVFPTYTQFSAKRNDWHKSICCLMLAGVLLFFDSFVY
nr:cobalt ECF transporter T component CbiQ [Desulfobulbaceae bacterium]